MKPNLKLTLNDYDRIARTVGTIIREHHYKCDESVRIHNRWSHYRRPAFTYSPEGNHDDAMDITSFVLQALHASGYIELEEAFP